MSGLDTTGPDPTDISAEGRAAIIVAGLPGSGVEAVEAVLVANDVAPIPSRHLDNLIARIMSAHGPRWNAPETWLPASERRARRVGVLIDAVLPADGTSSVTGAHVIPLFDLWLAALASIGVGRRILLVPGDAKVVAEHLKTHAGMRRGAALGLWRAAVLRVLSMAPECEVVADAASAEIVLSSSASEGDRPTPDRISPPRKSVSATARVVQLLADWPDLTIDERRGRTVGLAAEKESGVEPVESPEPPQALETIAGLHRLIAIIAPPRSGTTVTTAVLGAHSDVHAVYEPWNDTSQGLNPRDSMSLRQFCDRFRAPDDMRATLMVKETTASPAYIDRIAELLKTAPAATATALVVPLRNPFHLFLSQMHMRRTAWNDPTASVAVDAFTLWAQRHRADMRTLAVLAKQSDAVLLSYERFVSEPGARDALTRAVGLDPEAAQQDFERHVDPAIVRGDPVLAGHPEALSTKATDRRAEELPEIEDDLRASPEFDAIATIAAAFDALPAVSSASGQKALIRLLKR